MMEQKMQQYKVKSPPGVKLKTKYFFENTMEQLQSAFDTLAAQPFDEASLKIDDAICYLKSYNFKGQKGALVGCILYNLKQLNKHMGDIHHDSRKHYLSDHAFIRVLEIGHGLNIDDLKNRALQDIEDMNLRTRERGGQIVTVLPTRSESL